MLTLLSLLQCGAVTCYMSTGALLCSGVFIIVSFILKPQYEEITDLTIGIYSSLISFHWKVPCRGISSEGFISLYKEIDSFSLSPTFNPFIMVSVRSDMYL